jgi:hypothetical protein
LLDFLLLGPAPAADVDDVLVDDVLVDANVDVDDVDDGNRGPAPTFQKRFFKFRCSHDEFRNADTI